VTIIATHGIVVLLLTLLAATALTIVRMRDLWAAVMLTGIYSFLGAGWMMLLDAPDVAFTEAAVGAGIATVLMLGTLGLTSRVAANPPRTRPLPVIIVLLTGAVLVAGTIDMPRYGDPRGPVHGHVAPEYLADRVPNLHDEPTEVGVPNIVTAVLASYRGYDTLGETVVIFTAGIAVLLLLQGNPIANPSARESASGGRRE
jgi:multicomponent Na+:H+ antiporter subunit B